MAPKLVFVILYNMMQTKIVERFFFFGLLLSTLIFTFMIFKPFWAVFILGISFSIILYPIYEWMKRKNMSDWLAALLTLLLFVIAFCGPLLGLGALLFTQSQNAYEIVSTNTNSSQFINSINTSVAQFLPDGFTFDANEKISDFLSFLSANIATIFTSAVSAIVSFFLMLLVMFYFLRDGEKWRKGLIMLSPLSDKDDEKIINKLKNSVNAVLKGYMFIAVIQGIMMGFGLWVFGIPNPALWGVVAAIASMLPTIGTALVSVPAIIFLLATGHTTAAIGLAIWAALLVGSIDNFLSPLIVSGKTNIPSLLILFSVLGGIAMMGPIGLLVGPLTISLLYSLISLYRNEFKGSTDQ